HATDYQRHPEDHSGAHWHSDEPEPHVTAHPEHRQVQQDADGYGEAAQREQPRAQTVIHELSHAPLAAVPSDSVTNVVGIMTYVVEGDGEESCKWHSAARL